MIGIRAVAALVLAFLAGVAAPVHAAEPVRIKIVEFGIYTADIDRTVRDSNGIGHNVIKNICHVSTTSTVPATWGLHFGFRYRIEGATPGQVVDLRKVMAYPVNVQPPGAAKPLKSYAYGFTGETGSVAFTGYSFDHAWEFLPGTWTFQIFDGDRMLAEKTFTIVEGAGESFPSGGDSSNCFRISSL